MSFLTMNETAAPNTPASAKVSIYADTTSNPILKFKDDGGNTVQIQDDRNKIGYAAGQGGTVTQASTKATTVVLNKLAGEITLNNAALAAATIVSFTFTNSTLASGDCLILNHVSGGTIGSYTLTASSGSGTGTIYVRNNTAGSLSEAIVIRYIVIKGQTA
jgi:hypothetical protein